MQIKTVELDRESLDHFEDDSVDVLLVSTCFDPDEKYDLSVITEKDISDRVERTTAILRDAFRILKNGGLLFIYGLPKWLPFLAVYLDSVKNTGSKMIFKYWIALDLDLKPRKETLPPAHTGLLMYLKSRNGKTDSPFHLNTKTVRIPYTMCKACGKNTKDWGGKKHLLNPLGAAVSDVWRDLPRLPLIDNLTTDSVINRVYRLVEKKNINFIHAIESHDTNRDTTSQPITKTFQKNVSRSEINSCGIETDVVLHQDSLEYMKGILKLHPEGIFDFAFADPPYNLEKGYAYYRDSLSDQKYIQWSYTWLDLMSKVVRPGGAVFVLNLPKYCTYYSQFLSRRMNFRHWIVWDAMAAPAGKIMPAHYSLLYYTKPGGPITFNYSAKTSSDWGILDPLDADYYCLNAGCVEKRKAHGNDDKISLTDVWWNIHRIKHKKYRDQHPCQLPIKLMERIIKLATNENDIVFDPFCGAGTTAISAKMTGRHFVTMDIDEKYVHIAQRNLERMQPTLAGGYFLPRENNKYERVAITKKEVEIGYIGLCRNKGKVLNLSEVSDLDQILLRKITDSYKDFKRLQKIARRRLEIKETA
jgi:site-specific DNA-methyltransferase (adenine-specific)